MTPPTYAGRTATCRQRSNLPHGWPWPNRGIPVLNLAVMDPRTACERLRDILRAR